MGNSITTEQWKDHLYDYWRKHGDEEKIKILDSVDWNVSSTFDMPNRSKLYNFIGMVFWRRSGTSGQDGVRHVVG